MNIKNTIIASVCGVALFAAGLGVNAAWNLKAREIASQREADRAVVESGIKNREIAVGKRESDIIASCDAQHEYFEMTTSKMTEAQKRAVPNPKCTVKERSQ